MEQKQETPFIKAAWGNESQGVPASHAGRECRLGPGDRGWVIDDKGHTHHFRVGLVHCGGGTKEITVEFDYMVPRGDSQASAVAAATDGEHDGVAESFRFPIGGDFDGHKVVELVVSQFGRPEKSEVGITFLIGNPDEGRPHKAVVNRTYEHKGLFEALFELADGDWTMKEVRAPLGWEPDEGEEGKTPYDLLAIADLEKIKDALNNIVAEIHKAANDDKVPPPSEAA